MISQWVWNLRLELGHQLHPAPLRTTAFAEAHSPEPQVMKSPIPVLPNSGTPSVVRTARMGCLPGSEFPLQADGMLRCPAGHPLTAQERRNEEGGYRADRVCGQHWSLSPLPTARSLPGLRCQNLEAAPGECHPPSVDLTRSLDRDHDSSHRNSTTPVAKLEPMPDATRVDAAFAQSTP